MDEPTHKQRVKRAENILRGYDSALDNLRVVDDILVSDVMADLMHYCQSSGFDVERVVGRAFMHFREEVLEEEQDHKLKGNKP